MADECADLVLRGEDQFLWVPRAHPPLESADPES